MKRQQTRNPLVTMVATAHAGGDFPCAVPAAGISHAAGGAYLKMDFSDVPAAFGAVMFGPVCGLSVELIKNILEMLIRGMGTQMGFGNLQNFLIRCAYVLPYALLYRRMEGREIPAVWKMTLPCAAGIGSMLVVGFFSNWVVAPLFFLFFLNNPLGPGEALAAAWVSVPFNALKGAILTAILMPLTALTIRPVRRVLDGTR